MSLISKYNPNNPAVNNGRFMGFPFTEDEAECILLTVPWDATTSGAIGTASAPENILQASYQLDLGDAQHPESWKKGIYMVPPNPDILLWNNECRSKAKEITEAWESGVNVEKSSVWQERLDQFNLTSKKVNEKVYNLSKKYLARNKKVLLVGGDHSTPYGYLRALNDQSPGFGVLQIDAHCDLRKKYEGFRYSHASIMFNVMTDLANVEKLVQVGVRDWCPEEEQQIKGADGRIATYFMHDLSRAQALGKSWAEQCDRILVDLPEKVYISLDIDGLDPFNCPYTGTPVPGGMDYHQVIYLLEEVQRSGRQIVGADLCEVAGEGHEWDGNVGARLTYKLALLLMN